MLESVSVIPSQPIKLHRLQDATLEVPIIGVTPLIPHAWGEKSLRMMRHTMQNPGDKAKPAREAKNPEQEAHDSLYLFPDGRLGMQAVAFKGAMVASCRFFNRKELPMTEAKILFFVEGEKVGKYELVHIEGEKELREDTPRNATGVVDLRYRYQIWPWRATLNITYLPSVIAAESILSLVDASGRNGVGDWRPGAPKSHTGTYGRYQVDGVF